LDMAFLGMGEADESGNVNVSKLGKRITGSGGFIDISQNAKTMVFCGTFMNGETVLDIKDGKVVIVQEGAKRKFKKQVEQITFSGEYAARTGQNVLYVTERAVFKLEDGKMVLVEIAPGIDVEKDILAHMDFAPGISPDLKTMDPAIFMPETIMEKNPGLFRHFAER
jgi:propionate CoA-transferase